MLVTSLLVALGYLSGSVPFGVLLTRLRGVDVRASGSGNIGATNVARVAGKKLGVVVLLLDAAKGAGPVLLARHLLPDRPFLHAGVGLAAFFGHVFPIWLRLKGGKGVATAAGVLLVLVPWAASAGALTYALFVVAFRISSVGSLLGGGVAVAAAFVLKAPLPYAELTALLFALMLFTHRGNIRRLIGRSERSV